MRKGCASHYPGTSLDLTCRFDVCRNCVAVNNVKTSPRRGHCLARQLWECLRRLAVA